MPHKRIVFVVWEILFLAEALLQFLLQWRQGLAWLNPLLVSVGFAAISNSTCRPGPRDAVKLSDRQRRYGFGFITAAILLLGYRLTRF